MHRIDRRTLVTALALLPVAAVRAATPEQITVDADEGSVVLTRYAAVSAGKRPTVLMLHGLRGFDLKPHAYERYADALTAKGIDACFVRYYTQADAEMLLKPSTPEKREPYETKRFDRWADRVSSVVTAILARPDSSGRIGLLGFSLGGYVAADTAARDKRVDALAVLYGGMPDAMASQVKHLPPLIELHGEADRNVPFAEGVALVKLGKKVGAEAEQVPYPGKPHGFDFSDSDPASADAVGRVVGFFTKRLDLG